jgi:hypothetical protein
MSTKEKQLVSKNRCAKNDFIALLLSAKGVLAVFIVNDAKGGSRILLGRFDNIEDDCQTVCYEDFRKHKVISISFDRLQAFGILCDIPDTD